jgi:hypothetical protein
MYSKRQHWLQVSTQLHALRALPFGKHWMGLRMDIKPLWTYYEEEFMSLLVPELLSSSQPLL